MLLFINCRVIDEQLSWICACGNLYPVCLSLMVNYLQFFSYYFPEIIRLLELMRISENYTDMLLGIRALLKPFIIRQVFVNILLIT